MLQITALTKKYGNQLILNISSLNIQQGIYWLKGINGSGKSTFLKCASGLIPFDGDIIVNNISLKQQSKTYKKYMSYQAAEAALPPFLTGNEIIHYYQSLKNGNTQNTNYIIQQLDIAYFLPNKIGTYSSGMQKKLCLALAFIGNNTLILLDEPLTTIDKEGAEKFIQLIHSYSQLGTSFIITSHQDFEYQQLSFSAILQTQNNTITFAK